MKILIPTDFSEYADFSIDAAKRIIDKMGGQIILFHCFDNRRVSWDSAISNFIESEMDKKKLNRIEYKLNKQGYSTSVRTEKGNLYKTINEIVEAEDIDLIIMGSHGVSGREELFLGSNTQKVVRNVHTKVLILKNPLPSFEFQEVAFVTGLIKDDQGVFLNFLDFLSSVPVSKVHILTVDTSSYFTQPPVVIKSVLKDFESLAEKYNVESHFYRDYSVEAAVRHFSEEKNIQLIGISNRKSNPIKRFFQGSTVESLVNHLPIPILSIDY
jgi:nucleotide-binding universal stress UspA family protein